MERREFLMGAVAVPGLPRTGWDGAGRRASAARNPQADERFEGLSRLVVDRMAEYRVPGVAFGLVKDGRTLMRGFGVTSVEHPQPITPDTIFQLASVSKTVTATAIMKLVEQGRVDLRAPVRRYLPEFQVKDDTASRDVTVWHLLTHTAGWENKLLTRDRGTETLAHYVRSMSDVAQLAPPGRVWSYNSSAFVVAGRVIEAVTQMSIHDAFRDLVFAPLNLSHASTRLEDVMTHRVALGHRRGSEGASRVARPYWMGSSVPGGGVAMSLENLLRFAKSHLGAADAAPDELLSLATRKAMRAPQVRKHGTDDHMGIGWHLRWLDGVLTAAHGGSGTGHQLLLELVPARRLAFAILTNHTSGRHLIQQVERAVLRVYEELSLVPNQAISYRGVNEVMTGHASVLPVQPPFDAYVGSYRPSAFALEVDESGEVRSTRAGMIEVREEGGALVVDSGRRRAGQAVTTIAFYGPDVAYSISGASVGAPYEFIRAANGDVGWIRRNGQIARRE